MARIIEICANSVASCIEAERGGAARVELCAGIPEGGTTPSYGAVSMANALTSLAINVLIRPRGGDFMYSPLEIDTMMADIEMVKSIGVHGVVFGCLTAQGGLDIALMERLIAAARPLSVTCHRCFDVCREPFEALEQLIGLGCDRLLSSGQQPDALQGAPLLRKLVERADGRIVVMPGCGVRADNIAQIEAATGAGEFHASARRAISSRMEYRKENVPMGAAPPASEYETLQTDAALVAALVGS